MRHAKDYRKLGRTSSHYVATMRNLSLALLEHERITTTLPKAKELRRFAERLITFGKIGDLHRRRLAYGMLGNKVIILKKQSPKPEVFDPIKKVFGELAERYKKRGGGYTRIVRCGHRVGDGAPMAVIELIPPPGGHKPKPEKSKKEKETKQAKGKPAGDEKPKREETPKAKKASPSKRKEPK